MKTTLGCVALLAVGLLTGCSTYLPPAGRANFDAFIPQSDTRLQESFALAPAAGLPAHLVFARVQTSGYRNYHTDREGGVYGHGRYSIFTTRELDEEAELERLTRLPDVGSIGTLNRLLVPEELVSDHDLRESAARLKADMVVIYTFDTSFYTKERPGPAKVITLGNAHTRHVTVNVTASALVMDTRTGFIYAALESNERREIATNLWRNGRDADTARRDAEKAAFKKLADEFYRNWDRIAARAKQGA